MFTNIISKHEPGSIYMFDVNNMRKEYRRDVKKIQGEID
jgi:hypothetical protein